MKIVIFVLISLTCQAQFRKHIPSGAALLLAGAADGIAESVKWHYDSFDKRFNAYDPYWDPNISWKNKYLNNDPLQGPKFPGSTTMFVWVTDGYHMTRMVKNTSMVGAVVIHPWKKQKWYWYLIEFVSYYVTYNIGFTLTYR